MRYNFENLQTVQCFNAVELRVPARWDQTKLNPSGARSFYEEVEETGALFVSVGQPSALPKDASELDTRKFVEAIVKVSIKTAESPYSDSTILLAPRGHVWRARYDSRDSQGQLRNFQYLFFLFQGSRYTTIEIRLVLPFEVLNDDEILDLLGIMDREILMARLAPFEGLESPKQTDPGLVALFPSKHWLNFGDKLKLKVPQEMTGYSDLEGRWYCYLEPDDVDMRLWVSVNDYGRTDKRLGDNWAEVARRAVSNMLPGYTDDPSHPYDVMDLPGGIIMRYHIKGLSNVKSQVHGDTLPQWLEGDLQHLLWAYLRYEDRKARMGQFNLFFNDAKADEPKLRALIEQLDTEIPRAVFSGFDTPS